MKGGACVGVGLDVGDGWLAFGVVLVVDVGSLQPNHPGVLHVDVEVGCEVVVIVGAGDALDVVVVSVVVVESLQPNHPGVSHVVLELEVVVVDVVESAVVDSSRQPHHPGVLHVSVRVLVRVVVLVLLFDVVLSVPLLSKNFQL